MNYPQSNESNDLIIDLIEFITSSERSENSLFTHE